MKIGFVIALPQELKTLTRQRAKQGDVIAVSPLADIILSGIGPANATAAANHLAGSGATLLISWGCCAGLQEDLDAGTLVIPDKVIPADGHAIAVSAASRKKLLNGISKYATIHSGPIAEAVKLLREVEHKHELHDKTKAAAADMESAAIAKVAQKRNIDFIAIRAVADDFKTVVPSCIEVSMDENVNMSLFSFLINLLKRPSELSQILQIANGFEYAKKSLMQVAGPCLKSLANHQ